MLRSSPVNAIRLAMVAIVAAADLADSVSGEPERVYRPKWIGIEGFVKTSSTSRPAFMQAREAIQFKIRVDRSQWIAVV